MLTDLNVVQTCSIFYVNILVIVESVVEHTHPMTCHLFCRSSRGHMLSDSTIILILSLAAKGCTEYEDCRYYTGLLFHITHKIGMQMLDYEFPQALEMCSLENKGKKSGMLMVSGGTD